jgi:hypothetical protein
MRKRLLFLALITQLTSVLLAQVAHVKITSDANKWTLLVDEKPYYIKGAGGETHLNDLLAIGGNTIRTWGIDNAQSVLDEAQRKGVKVMLGLWVQHERHGFDYNDQDAVKAQLDFFRSEVKKYKNHPALLIWCVGNEYELAYSNTKVWSAVNDIAKMIHEEDNMHPTATVTAGTSDEKLAFVQSVLTAVDIYGINTYGDIENVKSVLDRGNFKGAYMITEWGPNGHWESPKTAWGSSVEQTSTQKTTSYKERYEKYIHADSAQCIGSFAFLWGQKQEYTNTWYGLFYENGMPTEAIDALCYNFTKKYPENRAPTIDAILFNNSKNHINHVVQSNELINLAVLARDLNNDKLIYTWELFPESEDLKIGGDVESKPQPIKNRIKGKSADNVQLKAPAKEGRYRVFVSVTDGVKMAYANIPFYVTYNPQTAQPKVYMQTTDLKSFEND